MSMEEFREHYEMKRVEIFGQKAKVLKAYLPLPEEIYYKTFHFLEVPLIKIPPMFFSESDRYREDERMKDDMEFGTKLAVKNSNSNEKNKKGARLEEAKEAAEGNKRSNSISILAKQDSFTEVEADMETID